MLLGASGGDTSGDGAEPDLRLAVEGGEDGDGDGGVAEGRTLRSFAEAVATGDVEATARCRRSLRDRLGDAALVDAAAVVALFCAVDRVADATGTRLDEALESFSQEIRATHGIDRFGA